WPRFFDSSTANGRRLPDVVPYQSATRLTGAVRGSCGGSRVVVPWNLSRAVPVPCGRSMGFHERPLGSTTRPHPSPESRHTGSFNGTARHVVPRSPSGEVATEKALYSLRAEKERCDADVPQRHVVKERHVRREIAARRMGKQEST